MIISASRRTDIPAFYSQWFFNRLKEGYVLVRNPMNHNQISKVSLKKEVVDFIVFWTKNPTSMLKEIDNLQDYKYYFQFTLNPYGEDIERNVSKKADVIESFKYLSDKIGANRVIWRYDPIIITEKMDFEYHYKYFEVLSERLAKHTNKCIISFMDFYRKIKKNINCLGAIEIDNSQQKEMVFKLKQIAEAYNLKLETCAENIELDDLGVGHTRCIDGRLIEEIIGEKLDVSKDNNQRKECGCAASIDIGAYNTCKHSCIYCYASLSQDVIKWNCLQHDPKAPMMIGTAGENDVITERKMKSCIVAQRSILDLI